MSFRIPTAQESEAMRKFVITPEVVIKRMSKDTRGRTTRPPRRVTGELVPMSHPSSPRRFLPPSPADTPMAIFSEVPDRSMNGFKRFVHRQDDCTALFFVDGACLDNGNAERRRAGCGVIWNEGPGFSVALEGTIGGPEQTSNRAELRAVILWIQLRLWEAGGFDRMVVATDSEYVVEGICSRVDNWKQRGWRTSAGTPVAHRDLWEMLLAELDKAERAEIQILFWRIPRELNSRADALAKAGAEVSRVLEVYSRVPSTDANRATSLLGWTHSQP
ncbi:hypothetical protein EYR38_002290 [Pleurotus pulmonarius]|nr:hypothetical protein EYR38_002290 [Pleurotus pulmonarius]